MLVLFVEDHTDTRGVLATLLNRCGCQTVTAKNIREARTRLGEMQFDVLISDLNLPDGDGLELAREAKQKHPVKTIALTGRATPEEREAGLAGGFDFYLKSQCASRQRSEGRLHLADRADQLRDASGVCPKCG